MFALEMQRSGESGCLSKEFGTLVPEIREHSQSMLRHEAPDGLRRIVDGHADDHQPALLVAVEELDEAGNLDTAGSAPGGPEVQHDNLAGVVGERVAVTVDTFELEAEISRRALSTAALTGARSANGRDERQSRQQCAAEAERPQR